MAPPLSPTHLNLATMIEELRSAGDQLRAAWDNYLRVFSALEDYHTQRNPPYTSSLLPGVSHQLDTEIAFLSSYESKIQQIKITISRARHGSFRPTSIHSLPPVVLARIFHLVVLGRPCNLHLLSSSNKQHYPRYPDYLAQVCSSWRRIAISSCSLWTHIDLSPYEQCYDQLITRAEIHLARAGNAPVELHIAENEDRYFERKFSRYYHLYGFISRASSLVESVELVVTGPLRGFHRSVFRELVYRQQSTITGLVVRSEGSHANDFICANTFEEIDSDDESELFEEVVTKDKLDRAFAPLTVLHLRGIFPSWSSTAYHGLVDLRLLSTSSWSDIREAELATILSLSPGLRILHFGLRIRELTPESEEVTPVPLQDLEVVKILTNTRESAEPPMSGVLRLLAPGVKSLRLSLDYPKPGASVAAELEEFFARSRVTIFHIRGTFPPVGILLRHVAHLERVMLDSYVYSNWVKLPSAWLQVDQMTSLPRLKSLHLRNSILLERQLRFLLECCPTGTTVSSCSVDRDGSTAKFRGSTLSTTELFMGFPSAKAPDHELHLSGDLTASWDIYE